MNHRKNHRPSRYHNRYPVRGGHNSRPNSYGFKTKKILLPAVVRMPGQYGGGPVNLFQQHDAHELMRPGGRTEGQAQIGLIS